MDKKSHSSLVVVVLVCTNEIHFLSDCLTSIFKQTYDNFLVYMVDNNSTDGTADYVQEHFPKVKVFKQKENLGYAGGNNLAFKKAFAAGAEFCLALNTDTKSDKDLLKELVNTYQRQVNEENIGLVQPSIFLFDKTDTINTVGNAIHYLGFGYCRDYMKNKQDLDLSNDKKIISVSGAALFISKKYYTEIGGFDEEFFLYNEDQNLSWRGLMQGYKHVLSVKAKLYHKYNFHRRPIKMYHSEKNRVSMLIENYSIKTLILILPIFLLVELLLLLHSIFNGWFLNKMASYKYVFSHMSEILVIRRRRQAEKKVLDRDIILMFDSTLASQLFDSVGIIYILNPILNFYFKLLNLIL